MRDVAMHLTHLPIIQMLTLMCILAPLVLDQKVTLQYRLDDEVVFLIATLKQVLLHDGKLCLIDADQARLCLCDCHFLPDLQVPVKEDLLAQSPTYVDSPNQMLGLLRERCLYFEVGACVARHCLGSAGDLEEELAE